MLSAWSAAATSDHAPDARDADEDPHERQYTKVKYLLPKTKRISIACRFDRVGQQEAALERVAFVLQNLLLTVVRDVLVSLR